MRHRPRQTCHHDSCNRHDRDIDLYYPLIALYNHPYLGPFLLICFYLFDPNLYPCLYLGPLQNLC